MGRGKGRRSGSERGKAGSSRMVVDGEVVDEEERRSVRDSWARRMAEERRSAAGPERTSNRPPPVDELVPSKPPSTEVENDA